MRPVYTERVAMPLTRGRVPVALHDFVPNFTSKPNHLAPNPAEPQ